jgi:NADH-quinone oxidoreductase subunit H
MGIKVVALLFGMIWVRATWPRIRYDRLMSFGWKVMLPLSLAVVFITALGILLADLNQDQMYMAIIPALSLLVALIAVALVDRALRRKTHATR